MLTVPTLRITMSRGDADYGGAAALVECASPDAGFRGGGDGKVRDAV